MSGSPSGLSKPIREGISQPSQPWHDFTSLETWYRPFVQQRHARMWKIGQCHFGQASSYHSVGKRGKRVWAI